MMMQHKESRHDDALPPVLGLADMLAVLRQRARLIVAAAAVAGALALLAAMLTTPRYEATATILIDTREKKIVDLDQVQAGMLPDTASLESEIEIAGSSAIAGRVIDELGLGDDPELTQRSRLLAWIRPDAGSVRPAPGLDPTAATGTSAGEPSDALAGFLSRLTVRRVRVSFMIAITFGSRDPEKAARIANAVAEAYLDEQVGTKMRAAEAATAMLDKRVGELKERLHDAERLVEKFKADNGIIDVNGRPLSDKALDSTADELVDVRTRMAAAQAKFERMQSLLDDGDPGTVSEMMQNSRVAQLTEDLARSTREGAELETRYGPMHPAMIKAQAQVQEIRLQLNAAISKSISSLRTEYELARERDQKLTANLEVMKSSAGDNGQASVGLREFEREADAARGIYETFLKRVQETQQQQSLQLADARIIERALPPPRPSAPNRMRFVVFGIAAGFGLSLALAFLYEIFVAGAARPERIEARLGVRHLASVPPIAPEAGGFAVDPVRQIRRIVLEPQSDFAETIRTLRIEIDSRRPPGEPTTILMASPMPGEGRSLIASNLAHAYAVAGVKTLLVDADLRRGALTGSLLPEAEMGLADCLIEGRQPRLAVVRDASTGVHFLPAGMARIAPGSAPEVLASRRFAAAIAALKGEFDVLVIDCPPLLAVVDGRIIAGLADDIVLVWRWQATPAQLVKRAVRNLGANADKIAGVVVNGVPTAELAMPTRFVAPHAVRRGADALAAA